MKIAVVYNRISKQVINLFGMPNREKYGLKSIKRITDALKKGGHQVIAFEGDKNLIDNLEDFMPQVMKGERPGMVFNLSYGIQGQARYTHVPGILECGENAGAIMEATIDAARHIAHQCGVQENGFRLVINNGADAGQAVEHLHTHFIAGRKLHWPPG